METAPQAFAEAERLHGQAVEAWESGDAERAQDMGVLASIAYQQAVVLGRLARAEQLGAATKGELDKTREQLSQLEAEQVKLEAEAHHLELRSKVIQDALPLAEVKPASPQRERARRAAARALLTDAKLLCLAETLTRGKRTKGTSELLTRIDSAASESDSRKPPELITESRSLRSACLKQLTLARRPATRRSPNAGLADALLKGLSEAGGFHPFRDDRGVVVLLGAPIAPAGDLASDTTLKLAKLGRIAREHPEFKVLVVWHSGGKQREKPEEASLLGEIRRSIFPDTPERITAESVGNTQPLELSKSSATAAHGSRLEVIFVSPSSS